MAAWSCSTEPAPHIGRPSAVRVKIVLVLLALALAGFGYRHFTGPITHPPGVLMANDPAQSYCGPDETPIPRGAFSLKPLARFSADVRVLHRKNYRYDREAALVPTDLAIGWGEMSNQAVLDRLDVSQSARFYFYEYRNPPPIAKDEIIRHSTNVHIIPADAKVAALCRSLRSGELVHLEGELVEASSRDLSPWRSSLTRDDSGRSACELLFAERVWKLDPTAVRPPTALVRR